MDSCAIRFDEIDDWFVSLSEVLLPLSPRNITDMIRSVEHEYIEQVRQMYLSHVKQEIVVDAMLNWIGSQVIVAYHGTRITTEDLLSIERDGLKPLNATSRRKRIERALSKHVRWNEVAHLLDSTIESFGPGCAVGTREGRVYLTLSKAGLMNGCSHYLTHGSEFDWHVATELLGEEGKELLRSDGIPYIIHVNVPGDIAIRAAHPIFSVESIRAKRDLPNILKDFLTAWCVRLQNPIFQASEMNLDAGMEFKTAIPKDWIMKVEPVTTIG